MSENAAVALKFIPLAGLSASTLLLALDHDYLTSTIPFVMALIADSPTLSKKFAERAVKLFADLSKKTNDDDDR